jgi:glycosyltransferase involved in cell wall biosynthesis
MKKIVSIIVPCYNDGAYLHDAINSVLKCDESLYELIIVNDGSTDELTLNILKQYEDKSFVIIHQKNSGLSAARNAGIRHSTGKYILPLDSDNKVRPEYLTEAVKVFEKESSVSVVYGKPQFFGSDDRVPLVGNFNLQKLMLGNYIDACAVYRKNAWESVKGYDELMRSGLEDWEFWLHLAFTGHRFYFIDQVLFDYRVRSQSMVRKTTTPRIKEIKKYMAKKYEDFLDFDAVNENIFQLFRNRPFRMCLKMYLKIEFPLLFDLLVKKGLIKEF